MSEEQRQSSGKPGDTRVPSGETQVGMIVKDVVLNLHANQLEKAADLFSKAQKTGILPNNRGITQKLLGILGENNANQLITAFAFHPCQFCEKGRTQCEICKGKGHIELDFICERCYGLGVARCSFCNGSAWLALPDIPEGIRTPAIIKRAEKTLEDAKLILKAPIPDSSKETPISVLHKCAAFWVAIDKLMGVLENVVVYSQTLTIPSEADKRLGDIVQPAVRTGAELEQRLRDIIAVMQKSSETEAKNYPGESSPAKRAENRAAFYKSLLSKSSFIYKLDDAHPLLEEAIRKEFSKKPDEKAGG